MHTFRKTVDVRNDSKMELLIQKVTGLKDLENSRQSPIKRTENACSIKNLTR